MPRTHHVDHPVGSAVGRTPIVERTVTEEPGAGTEILNLIARIVAAAAGGILLIVGLVGLARINWVDGFDMASAVEVGGMTYTPAVALGTAILGLLALFAGASWDRDSKLVMGGVLLCVGIAILSVGGSWQIGVAEGHGWLAIVVGVVQLLAGVLVRPVRPIRRVTEIG